MMWSFIHNEVLGMQWLNRMIGKQVELVGLDPTSRIGGSVQFFFYDVLKIMLALVVNEKVVSMGRVLKSTEAEKLLRG